MSFLNEVMTPAKAMLHGGKTLSFATELKSCFDIEVMDMLHLKRFKVTSLTFAPYMYVLIFICLNAVQTYLHSTLYTERNLVVKNFTLINIILRKTN